MKEWNWEKNDDQKISPYTLTMGSNKKVWWKCEKNHVWAETVANRSKNRNCPYCSGHRVWIGFNDLETTHSALCNEWDYNKNDGHLPTEFSKGSSFLASWICQKGHSYKATIANRTGLNRGCPYCAGRYVIKGENDLLTINPGLAEEWDYEKNIDTHPSEITASNPRKVWWKGKCGHSWQASVNSRNRGSSCPICAHITIDDTTSLAAVNQELSQRWHPNKNGDLTPSNVFPYSTKKVWWICEKGHEFQSTVANQNRAFSCPKCNNELKTSFPEQAIMFYVVQIYQDARNRYKDNGYELDIFIPSLNIGIEYDGLLYHNKNTKLKEEKKDNYYNEKGVTIIRVKETKETCLKDSEKIIWHKINPNYIFLDDTISKVIKYISSNVIDINVKRDSTKIMASYLSYERENSIASRHPHLLSEWDYEKNGYLNPNYVSDKSCKHVWWKCEKGHSFSMTPAKRTTRNQNCPYCSGRYATTQNNLSLKYPNISKEWNYERNLNEIPEDFTPTSGKKVWWKCSTCSHEYEMSISNRTHNGQGCPLCAESLRRTSFNKTILNKNGSFASKHPELLTEWDYSKNKVSPNLITEFSKEKIWWKCKTCGNEWETSAHNRSNGSICPECAKRNRARKKRKAVLKYDADGNLLKEYESASAAGNEIKKDCSLISMCCNGRIKTAYGYIWRYKETKDENAN